MKKKYNGLVFSDGKGRRCIHGTDPTHPYVVHFINHKGVVGVKSPDEYGGEATSRIRCITWNVLTGETSGDNYNRLIKKGWERKPGDTHVSVRLKSGKCSQCGSELSEAVDKRVNEAIEFLS